MTRENDKGRYDGSEIAIVGMHGTFPGAPDLDAYWRNLEAGVESIASFSPAELREAGESEKRLADPDYVAKRPVLEGVELFDAAFFGLTPREAEVLDPQIRRFLECAVTALEHAGHDVERFPGRVSLFAGSSFSNYLIHNLYENRPVMEAFGDQQSTIFNVPDSLVTMVGYKLNLKGVCCAVQTFCSTSLVGVHLACQNLLGFESDLALAGGVSINVPQKRGYLYEEGSILSREGHCRVFDARADGTIFGNGAGVVVLRRLEDALSDGDTVHAIIRGSAVNNDGSLKVSYAAPGVVGQTEVIVEALAAAGVSPDTIQYVEAHGTGTRLGDPAEVSALTKAYRTGTPRKGFCGLGSVKGNVGHLDAAAGVAGLIKVVLALRNGRIPPSLHYETPNPAIDFANSPFYVNASLREWPRGPKPRRAGVSAFGVGGTNAHVILEEAPTPAPRTTAAGPQLLVLSARSERALETAAQRLAAALEADPDLDLGDVAFTLQQGRRALPYRRFVVAADGAHAAAALRAASPAVRCERRGVRVAFRFDDDAPQPFRSALQECMAGAPTAETMVLDAKPSGLAAMLHQLGRLWAAGVEPDWSALHAGQQRRRVALPTYPFERERAWVDPVPDAPPVPERRPLEWLYRPVWKRAVPEPVAPLRSGERWLVFEDSRGIARGLAERLREAGNDVIRVGLGLAFGGDPDAGYAMAPGSQDDAARLWADLAARDRLPQRVLHAWGLEPLAATEAVARFREASELTFYSLLHLMAARPSGALAVVVLADGLADVLGGDTLHPEKAPLVPLCRVLAQEQHDLTCQLIDVDETVAAEALASEVGGFLALRRGRRWVQEFERLTGGEARAEPRIRERGVYLITGGLGDIGFVLGLGLAKRLKARLVLTGRSGLPEREAWAGWLASHDTLEPVALRIRKVQALETLGAEVLVLKADASDPAAMAAAVATCRERWGAIHGVFHAAGELAADTFAPAGSLTRAACERQFAPKVLGTLALDAALRDGPAPDFCLLIGSLSSVLGGLGYAAYAGANAFLDGVAAQKAQAGASPWISVDWDQWEFAGRNETAAARQASKEGATLRPNEGLLLCERILGLAGHERLVVSTSPLAARLARWVGLADATPPAAAGASRPRPALTTALVEPTNEVERLLVGIWQELLGIAPVGIHDDFFELGGHSLFAARVLSRVRGATGVSLPVEAIFEAPTIAALAARVTAATWARRPQGSEAAGDRVEIEI